ncbi:hypothetical protein ACQCLI_12755 [Pseudomonas nitroreducens]|uniref:hypothetical protein n=1 Tax=Pseudomonas nitroreducens TaxID=46680 RepID=UPI003CFC3AA3
MQKANGILLASLISALSHMAQAGQPEIPVITGVQYNKARELLISKGWQPVATVSPNEKFESDQAEQFRKAGFIEINDCAPTGASPCILYFKSATGEKLKVITVGESNVQGDDFPSVSNYELVSSIPGQDEAANTESTSVAEASTMTRSSAYPDGTKYLAEVTCSFGERNVNVISCFVNTDLKIRTPQSAEIYKAYNLTSAGRLNGNILVVPLQEHFELLAQNSHKSLALGVKIKSLDGNVVFADKVGQYDVIRVQN